MRAEGTAPHGARINETELKVLEVLSEREGGFP